MANFEFSYDEENDDLLLFRKKAKSKGGIEFGNLVLDFDSKKMLVGMQIMEATGFICEMTNTSKRTIKKILANLERCEVATKQYGNMTIYKVTLLSSYKEKTEIPVTLPSITTPSPAITYA